MRIDIWLSVDGISELLRNIVQSFKRAIFSYLIVITLNYIGYKQFFIPGMNIAIYELFFLYEAMAFVSIVIKNKVIKEDS